MVKCPESIEELQELERLLPLCKKTLYETAQAKLESGAASSIRDAARQIGEETGRSPGVIRVAIQREERERMATMLPPCETELQGDEKHPPQPITVSQLCKETLKDGETEGDEKICLWCKDYDYEKEVCWRFKCDMWAQSLGCDNWKHIEDDEEEDQEDAKESKPSICSLMTGDQESYTPEKYIEAARLTMGSIDLDPASNEFAQKTVKATTYYTKEENGLDKNWDGNIFLNPPYSHPDIKHFVDKLLSELKPNQQAVLLTNNNTDTNFFHNAARKASVVCFTKGRINFNKLDGSTSSPTNGQVFFYFGENTDEFIKNFSEFGLMMVVI